jgi:hypothetical protein
MYRQRHIFILLRNTACFHSKRPDAASAGSRDIPA